jgi:SRSO17 transposase
MPMVSMKNITFPLLFKVFKPKRNIEEGEKYQTKIELALEIVRELLEFGFKIDLVLADSLYGETSSFIRTLDEYKLPWIVAIRSNHGVWLPPEQRVRANKWHQFQRIFSNQASQTRYIREIIFGKRSSRSYWEITIDPETLPENSTVFVMTNLQGNIKKI